VCELPYKSATPIILLLFVVLCVAPVSGQVAIPVFTRVSSEPVLRPTQGWEGSAISKASVIYDEGKFKMWYTGGEAGKTAIGYATSNDGMNWTKYDGNPMLQAFSSPTVVKVQGAYYMYYGYDNDKGVPQIGLSTSTDGISWTSYSGNPLPMKALWPSSILHINDRWMLWYATGLFTPSFRQVIAYANSSDGKTWNEVMNPVALKLPSGYTVAYDAAVVFAGGLYNMWATLAGRSKGFHMFYYTSADGLNWTLSDQNPLSGETRSAVHPSVLTKEGVSYLWYVSQDAGVYGIYLATSTTPLPEFLPGMSTYVLVMVAFSLLIMQSVFRKRSFCRF
jgi:predicted GH43/DUF377 family glycosyl hydrolase